MLPAKADPEKQKEYLEEEMESRLEEAKVGKRVVLFVWSPFCVICFSGVSVVGEAHFY